MTKPTNKEIREYLVEHDGLEPLLHKCAVILLDRLEAADQRIKEIESVSWAEQRIKELEADYAEVNADFAAERRVNHTLQESLNTAESNAVLNRGMEVTERERAERAESQLKAIGGLPDRWETDEDSGAKRDGWDCAHELQALLEQGE